MAHAYSHLYDFQTIGLRFFTVYGPWGRPDMAYFSFTRAIIEGKPIEIYNRGNMLRDFTYIDDIVEGTIAAIDLAAPYALFNLGHHHPEELLHLIALLEKELGKSTQKIFLPMQPGDVVSTYADIKESKEQLNFTPKVPLDVGIQRFVAWYRTYYS